MSGKKEAIQAVQLTLGGRVQGVGFRPFVYRMAHMHQLHGWVCNQGGNVEILVQGVPESLALFCLALTEQAPPLAQVHIQQQQAVQVQPLVEFSILESHGQVQTDVHLPPDYYACKDCLEEFSNPKERRYRYPFTNCTQCGPRYTLIRRLPYDRPNTSLANFPLCNLCVTEYRDPQDRRFHAEPIACEVCGPHLQWQQDELITNGNEPALREAIHSLKSGNIIAIKGIGGYHLACDATNGSAILRLRQRKGRPDKPLAVMFPQVGEDGLEGIRQSVSITTDEAALLRSPARPIVLARRKANCRLPPEIAPGLSELGVFLPYSPLHHILLSDLQRPLVMTSGNLSGEPVLTENQEAIKGLSHIVDGFLHHNRPIVRPADDSVFRSLAGIPLPLRAGRGIAPQERALPMQITEPTLALGGHMKNTVALAWENRIVISPHIGDMGSLRSQQVFEQLITDLQNLYQVQVKRYVCDAHPEYRTHRWASSQSLPLVRVLHHHAHASALAGEYPDQGPWLLFTWDGTGLGEHQALWGGETFFGNPGQWQRVATLRPFRLPGGDQASREPWRSAAALCWETGREGCRLPEQAAQLQNIWQRGIHCPTTHAAGRLFDAAASILGLLQHASFEAQGPMLLEAIAHPGGKITDLPLRQDGSLLLLDWEPLLPMLLNEARTVADRAADFHTSLAHAIVAITRANARKRAFRTVGLCGGVFQNNLLTTQACHLLQEAGFRVQLASALPSNDAALSFGQIIELAART